MTENRVGFARVLHHEATGAAFMAAAATLAVAFNNSSFEWLYDLLLDTPVSVRVGPLVLDKSLLHWINDGLMAIFFLYVGLEIKRELLTGALSSADRALLPAVGAFGGMLLPALIYCLINIRSAAALRGWAIPSATDIAFAVAVVTTLGTRVPSSLKVFLLALAILDDLGAIVIIALFYTSDLSVVSLLLAAAGCTVLAALNRCRVERLAAYMLAGIFIWICVLKSGVHATLAGVLVAAAVPLRPRSDGRAALLDDLQAALHPWVTFAVLPLFAFANAGVSLTGLTLARLVDPVPLGIALGLFVGKPVGIAGAAWLAIRSGYARLPDGASWQQMIAIAMLGGIGFTMSLFIGMLAFTDPAQAMPLRIGVLTGSLLSAAAGFVLLWRTTAPSPQA